MKKIPVFLISACFILSSSCVTILSPKKQTVQITTNNPKATLFVDKDSVGVGSQVEAKLSKDMKSKQIKVQAPGYKPTYYAAIPYKMNPLACVSCLFLYYPMGVDLANEKSYNYKSTFEFPLTTKRNIRQADQKYISVDQVKFDIKNKDFKFKNISYNNYIQKIDKIEEKMANPKKGDKSGTSDSDKDIKLDNTIFSDQLEKVLKETGYIDTVNIIFKDNQNSLMLNAELKSIVFYHVTSSLGNGYVSAPGFYICKSDIKWNIMNTYGEIVKSVNVRSQSGEFVPSDKDIQLLLGDMIENSLNQVLSNSEVTSFAKMEKGDNSVKLPLTSIAKPSAYITNAADAQNATVIVKTEEGHGSGFAISNDGYIVTNYHVIAGTDPTKPNEATIILGDGTKAKATVVKVCKPKDLALLKIDSKFEKCFALPTAKNFTPLEEVYVMGAPKSIELGQSASKGIISSERNINNVNVIQTNISVSPGNSGGPMFNKEGKLYGVVVSKLVGAFAEGVAFCIPAYRIGEYLNIEIK